MKVNVIKAHQGEGQFPTFVEGTGIQNIERSFFVHKIFTDFVKKVLTLK